MDANLLTTIVASICSASGVGMIEFLIRRHDEKHDKTAEIVEALKRLEDKIDLVDAKGDERNAINSRVRILRFEDELQEGRRHSKDSFDQCLTDISEYTHYSATHPDFKNDQTEATIEHIKHVYQERLEKRDFLKGASA